MNSFLDKNIDSLSIHHPYSLDVQDFSCNKKKFKRKKEHNIYTNRNFYYNQGKKGQKFGLKDIEKYVHKYFVHFYQNTKDDYNIKMINDILSNETTHLVAEFKDFLIMGDITEFLNKSYNINECKKFLPKIYDYYISCSVIFPNYITLHESKYIYKNIRKKQKVIDNQQEQEEKQEKIKKGDIKLDDNDEYFSSKTLNSILDQTNTSNVKCLFGLNNDKNTDPDETPNNIVAKLEQAENDAIQRKTCLVKNHNNSMLNNNNVKKNINDNYNTINNINNNNNNNVFINNSRLYIKNKYYKEKNNKDNGNIHYISSQNRNNIKLNMNSNSNVKNSNANNQHHNNNKIIINSYLSKNNQHKTESDSRKNIISSTNITDTDNENINNKNNCITFYGNNYNNSKRKDTRKILFESSDKKPVQIYNKNRVNQSNKNINNQYVNTLFPTKNIISNIFNHFDSNSVLKHNSFNFINQKYKKNAKERNNYICSPNFPFSPSSIAIEAEPIRKKYNININIKESNSTQNVINKNKKKKCKFY